ncbi:MAG: hypothetical protein KAR13_16260 [Desulfobulbaceae bacterium]|nr:hypothetical protein [Desulfobulbaceae bacterium]
MSRYAKNKMSNWFAGIAVHKNARAIFITLLVALFMVTTGALPALAADGKIYPGSMGVRTYGISTPTYYSGTIGNPSATSWLNLVLPAIHDTIGGNINKSWVRVNDRHCRSNIRCKLYSRYKSGWGWYGWFSPTRYSSGSGCNEQVLSPGMIEANSISHCYFSCEIPPMYNNNISYINSYSVQDSTHW